LPSAAPLQHEASGNDRYPQPKDTRKCRVLAETWSAGQQFWVGHESVSDPYRSFDLVFNKVFTRPTLSSAVLAVVVCLSVRPSVTSRCSTETVKRRITQAVPRDSPGTLIFCCRKSRQNSNGVTANGGVICRWCRLNTGAVP